MKKIRFFALSFFSVLTVFFACPFFAFASDSVTFNQNMLDPTWEYVIDRIEYYDTNVSDTTTAMGTDRLAQTFVYVYWTGTFTSRSEELLPGGYSYSGTMSHYSQAPTVVSKFDITGNQSIVARGEQVSVDSIEYVVDGTSYEPFVIREGLNYTTNFTVKDLYVSASNRVLLRYNCHGYFWFNLGAQYKHGFFTNYKLSGWLNVTVNGKHVLTGTTSGFKDNLSDFNSGMNSGTQAENSLTDKAFDDINSFEFKDINSDSSILSSLTFYSSVISLAYTSLGSTLQTLLAVSFGVLIVIFILRIRRDTS